jgi:hypothetical protein
LLVSFALPLEFVLFPCRDLVFVLASGDPFFSLCFFLDFSPAAWCARGNQRNRDRERAQARKPNAKDPQDGLTSEQRRERSVCSVSPDSISLVPGLTRGSNLRVLRSSSLDLTQG